ncbi:MAG TPA: hypothetical protein VFY65_06900, partial [Longimicrobium sp.]|nr:hypothetical protein [Longimicrobium sp.]
MMVEDGRSAWIIAPRTHARQIPSAKPRGRRMRSHQQSTSPRTAPDGTTVADRFRFIHGEAPMHDVLRDRILRHLESLPE